MLCRPDLKQTVARWQKEWRYSVVELRLLSGNTSHRNNSIMEWLDSKPGMVKHQRKMKYFFTRFPVF
jgi:hypothetical protein